MAAVASRAPPNLQPRPKATATSNTCTQSAIAATRTPILRSSTPVSQTSSRQLSNDLLSEKATTSLIRRTLCTTAADKTAPISELLPPLTSSNDVDLELYAFIAIVMKEFIYSWYAKITPDQVFVEELVRIIAHCTRALEQRLRKIDLEALILDELPELIDAHARAYGTASCPLHPSPLATDHRAIYHSLWPHPALSPVPSELETASGLTQTENEAAYRQLLVQSILAILLPTEDLENGCLTALTGQIFAEMIIGNGIGEKACEPWVIWDGITNIAEIVQARVLKVEIQDNVDESNTNESNTTSEVNDAQDASNILWSALGPVFHYMLIICNMLRSVVIMLVGTSSLPSRLPLASMVSGSVTVGQDLASPTYSLDTAGTKSSQSESPPFTRPILSMSIWKCASDLLDLDARMPWLSATFSMIQWWARHGPGHVGETDGVIDRLLSHAVRTRLLDPMLLPTLLRSARAALFPGNSLAASRPKPPLAEQLLIRRRCAETLLTLVPSAAQAVYFGPGTERRFTEVEELLNVFQDSYCNKHLVYAILDLIVVRLIPEMAEKGVSELLEERLD